MWKIIKISQQTYFINCHFTSTQKVSFILYDLKETWCETLALHEIKQNVKKLNKRYDFNEDNIRETLLKGDLESATLEQLPHTSSAKQESCVIKLKYRFKNCPFNLEWTLRRQTLEEFQSTFMQPLFTALFGCYQQVEILTDSLRKKDAELAQYRIEGFVLNRRTLATKPFDFEEFDKKYQTSTELATNYAELAKFVINTKPQRGQQSSQRDLQTNKEETKREMSPKAKSVSENNANAKMSPKQRKRKVQELKQQEIERRLKVSKQQFEYESSQSQATTFSSQSNEETLKADTKIKLAKDLVQSPSKKENESDEEDNINASPQRRTRCIPIKSYSTDEATDSESDTKKIKPSKGRGKSASKKQIESESDNINSSPRLRTRIKSVSERDNVISTPRRSCKKMKSYEEKESSDDETDSESSSETDSESDSKPLKKRKTIEAGKSSNKDKNDANPINAKTKPNTISKSPNLSQRKTLKKSSQYSEDPKYVTSKAGSSSETDSESDSKPLKQRKTIYARKSSNKDKNQDKPINAKTKTNDISAKEQKSNTISKSPILSQRKSLEKSSQNTEDPEYIITSQAGKALLNASPNTTEVRKTRSSPQVLKSSMENDIGGELKKSPCKNLSHSSNPLVDDISLQLNAIKKELESLEALRLADLHKRTCKA